MNSIRSRDGTTIAFERSGDGPALVLVHGGISDHTYWEPVLGPLTGRFTVFAVERRGRGQSGDADGYAIEREFEDVAALVDSIGEPVNLLGHSFGAICALEAALLAKSVDTLVLYEPPVDPDGFQAPPGFVERMEALLAAGDRDGVVEAMMTEVVGLSQDELTELRASHSWPALVATAHTLPREGRGVLRYRFEPDRFLGLRTPTVLLEGDQTPDELRVGVRVLHETLPDSRVVTMPGVGHEAVETGPELFATTVLSVLDR